MSEKMQKQRCLFGKRKGRVLEIVREKALCCHPLSKPLCQYRDGQEGIEGQVKAGATAADLITRSSAATGEMPWSRDVVHDLSFEFFRQLRRQL